jgi:lipoate-protein ligase A
VSTRPTEADNEASREIARDFDLLEAAERGGPTVFRTWRSADTAVVLGLSRKRELEVDEDACRRAGVNVLRRASGGGTVVVGPGTLQYAFVLPYRLSRELAGIRESKAFCNRLLVAALQQACPSLAPRRRLPGLRRPPELEAHPSGDLLLERRKVAGVALKRKKHAMLLHGTVLEDADLGLIARVLRHPESEPDYRGGRGHLDFLANLGTIDATMLEDHVRRDLAAL